MSSTPKHRSWAASRTLLVLLLLTPVIGLGTCMVQTHRGASTQDAAVTTTIVVAACLAVGFAIIRLVRWHRAKGPSSIIPGQ